MHFEVEFGVTDQGFTVDMDNQSSTFKPDFGKLQFVGGSGTDGKSAFEIAVDHGFEGTEEEWLESLKGEDGQDGKDGINGVSATHSWNGTTLTITSASGTSSADLKGDRGLQGEQGLKGDKGDPGEKGDPGMNGVDGKDGQDGSDGYTPVKGTDYFTDADKVEMVNAVIASLPVYDGSVVSA